MVKDCDMDIYISCDIEGIGCVVRPEHSTIPGRDYLQSRRLMTAEVNAAIAGACEAGAAHVVVADAHNVGLNILPEELDERAELIMGAPRPLSMMAGVEEGFDAVFLIGYHAKPGTQNGLIVHNHHSRIRTMFLSGPDFPRKEMGELGMNAALAGLYDAPVVLVSGDETTCLEAHKLIPSVNTVAVKRGMGAYAARCLHPRECRRRIYAAACQAVGSLSGRAPLRIGENIRMELEFTTASGADQVSIVPGLRRTGPMSMEAGPLPLRDIFNMFITVADLVDQVPYL